MQIDRVHEISVGSLISWRSLMLSDTVLTSFIHWLENSGLNECSRGDAELQQKSDTIAPKAMFGLKPG